MGSFATVPAPLWPLAWLWKSGKPIGDHTLACARAGRLARHARSGQSRRACMATQRKAVGPETHMVPQHWLAHTKALGLSPGHTRVQGHAHAPCLVSTLHGAALCCDLLHMRAAEGGLPNCIMITHVDADRCFQCDDVAKRIIASNDESRGGHAPLLQSTFRLAEVLPVGRQFSHLEVVSEMSSDIWNALL